MRTIFLALFALLLLSTADAQFKTQRSLAVLHGNMLLEASGIEKSYKNPGYFWSHNDSGGKPAIYLIDSSGNVKMEVMLQGVKNRDWEEIATVKEEGESYIYIAEIGDNRAQYSDVKLLKINEPTFNQSFKREISYDEISSMTFKYAEGPRDAEALFYDYATDEFVLVTKRETKAMVYSFPFKEGENPVTISSLGEISDRNFTAADMNEQGEILLKNYGIIYFFEKSDMPAAKRLLEWNPSKIRYVPEPQGEAICWMGEGFYTLSEKNKGFEQELFFFEREE